MLFEQLETRIPPGSLLVSPLGDAALVNPGQTMPPWSDASDWSDRSERSIGSISSFNSFQSHWLDGWTVTQSGGSAAGQGSVVPGSDIPGSAVLHEGDSFLVSLQRTITIPDAAAAIAFTYIDSFDTTDPDSINDAFEVTLTDANGYPLADTFTARRDAFFNLTEGMSSAGGSQTSQTAASQGSTVTLDISTLPAGTDATLTFRLVNNDRDTGTNVTLLSTDVLSQTPPPTVTVGLLNDTAPDGPGSEPYRTDLLTNAPTVTGTVDAAEGLVRLEAQINDGPLVDITAAVSGNAYTFDPGPLAPGPHRISVRATDGQGHTGSDSLDFRVNQPPVAAAGPARTVDEGSQVVFDASGSQDAEDGLFAYLWTFHDGSTSAAGISVSRDYPQEGDFPVTLTVTDTAGSIASHTTTITVTNVAPTVLTASDLTGVEGSAVDFLATYRDPGLLDTHTAVIDWGDGSSSIGSVSGSSGQGTVTGSHVYADDGVYTIRVEVMDDGGLMGSRTAAATIGNLPPTVLTATDVTGIEGAAVDFLATFRDPGVLDTHTAVIDWGDGSSSVGSVSGSSGQGTVTGSHVYSSAGTYAIRIEVTDNAGDSGDRLAAAIIAPQLTSSISGYVYFDVNNNGVKEPSEWILQNVPITLDGPVSRAVTTDTNGFYRFDQLPAGTYSVTQTQPRAHRDGQTSQGTPPLGFVENNRFYGIELPANVHATDYNFGERGLRSDLISKRLLIVPPLPGTPLYSEAVIRGRPWYAFDVTADGWVTVTMPASVSNPIIELYTRKFMPVAIAHGQHHLGLAVQQGDQFTLHTDGQTDGSGFDVTLQWSPQPPIYHTNPDNALDVNGDGIVTALDALIVVHVLNLSSQEGSAARSGAGGDGYLDVDGNGLLTAADVLMVINHLNARPVPGGGVGEQGAMGAADGGSAAFAEHGPATSPVRWIHDGDGWWDEPAKWSTGAVPGADDDVIIE